MRLVRRLLPPAVIIAACAFAVFLPDIGPDTYTDLDTLYRTEMKRQTCPGLAIVAIRDGVVVYRKAFGVDGSGHAMTVDTPVYLGPASEVLTGALVLTSVLDGSLDLQQEVWNVSGARLPENYRSTTAPEDDPGSGTSITLADLISHADPSGVFGTGRLENADFGFEIRELDPSGLTSGPSSTMVHRSGSGYRALAQVLERSTSLSFNELLQRRIVRPLGMSSTTAKHPVSGSIPRGSGLLFGMPIPYPPEAVDDEVIPASGIVSTARDMGRFLSYIAAPRGVGIAALPVKSVPMVYQPLFKGALYGYGWRINEKDAGRVIHQGGTILGFASTLVLWPDRKSALVLLAAQGGYIQSSIVLPSLAAATSGILFGGKAPKTLPIGRILVLGAVAFGVYLFVLAIQTAIAFSWARSVKDRSEARGSLGPVIIAGSRNVIGIAVRIGLLMVAPWLVGKLFGGGPLSLRSLFLLEPGMASVFTTACAFGLIRNLSRFVWLYSTTNRKVFLRHTPVLIGMFKRKARE